MGFLKKLFASEEPKKPKAKTKATAKGANRTENRNERKQ